MLKRETTRGLVPALPKISVVAGAILLTAACGPTRYDYPEQIAGSEQNDPLGERADGGRGYLFTGNRTEPDPEETPEAEAEPSPAPAPAPAAQPASAPVATVVPSSAVNPYLWQASLDTLAGLPIATADPQSGAIVTGWHAYPDTPNRRVKAQATILSPDLMPSALNVNVFWQEVQDGAWVSLPPAPRSKTDLEAAILMRAWGLRNRTAGAAEPFKLVR